MTKPSRELMRELWNLGFAIIVYLVLMAGLWVYLLLGMLSAAYAEILAHCGIRDDEDSSH
jgi:hypothetical protein